MRAVGIPSKPESLLDSCIYKNIALAYKGDMSCILQTEQIKEGNFKILKIDIYYLFLS